MGKGFLEIGSLHRFLETLRDFGELHAPLVSNQGVRKFAPLPDPSQLRLDYTRTLIPPKKYLFPFREEILQYADGSYREPPGDPPQTVLFGVHRCDLQGIAYLDRVFLAERPDPSYARRRSFLTLVGISCTPDGFCFCSDSIEPSSGDLFLTQIEDGFELEWESEKGEAIAAAAEPLLSPPKGGEQEERPSCPILPQDPNLRFSENPLWEKFASRCVSCGACSVCCPTCYCFDVREYHDLSGGGARVREWDNCFFLTHGEVAGANFRPTRLDRIRYRFLHKYCGFTPLIGMTSCVGCGRCKAVCPVDIDLRELLDPPPRPTLSP